MYKIFLVDDEYRIKERMLNITDWENTEFVFCGEASDGEMALCQIGELKPDIVITDIEMPFMNGLELSSIIKTTMPWIEIILLSGYDEFQYAKEALNIGISDYLLKPVRLEEINAVLNKVIKKLEDEKEKRAKLLEIENKLESISLLKKNSLFEVLLSGVFETKKLMEEYRNLGIDILKQYYMVIDVKISGSSPIDYEAVRSFCNNALEKIENVVYGYSFPNKLVVVLRGNAQEAVKEHAFALASTMKYEIERIDNNRVIIGIGNVTDRISNVSISYLNANKARSYFNDINLGQIFYIEDIENKMIDTEALFNNKLFDELNHIQLHDADEFLAQVVREETEDKMLRYYKLNNFIFECARIVKQAGGSPSEILPQINEQNLLDLVKNSSTDDVKAQLGLLLSKMIEYRNENGGTKYSDIIRQAKEYIKSNYAQPSISLNSVAKHVCMSPNHFSMIFSNETNSTFIGYLTNTRIGKSKELLKSTDMKLSVIADKVGYNEAQYFSYIFKKNTGMSPREYRINTNI